MEEWGGTAELTQQSPEWRKGDDAEAWTVGTLTL